MTKGIGERTLFDLYERESSFEANLKGLFRKLQQQSQLGNTQTSFLSRMSKCRMAHQRYRESSQAQQPTPETYQQFMDKMRRRLNREAKLAPTLHVLPELPKMADGIRPIKRSAYRSLSRSLRNSSESISLPRKIERRDPDMIRWSSDLLKASKIKPERVETLLRHRKPLTQRVRAPPTISLTSWSLTTHLRNVRGSD